MTRPAVAFIDLEAFRANYQLAASLSGDAQCVAVIKANGYGHGICEIAKELPLSTLAVACVDEAVQLRASGVDNPIVVLEGAFSVEEARIAADLKLQLIIHAGYQIEQLETVAADIGVWVKINTGMNRLGFAPPAVSQALSMLRGLSSAQVLGLMTHFACADEIDTSETKRQLAIFSSTVKALGNAADGLLLTAANSAALLAYNASHFNSVRPGVMLYGSSPFAHRSSESLGLKPVMSLESRIMAIHEIETDECVGYGGTWRASRATRIATVAIGYGDGYPRHAEIGTPVWIGDRVVPLIGRVSMDMLNVDLSFHPDAKVGDVVELWGKNVSVDEVAKSSGTISYELLTGVTARVPRQYLNSLSEL